MDTDPPAERSRLRTRSLPQIGDASLSFREPCEKPQKEDPPDSTRGCINTSVSQLSPILSYTCQNDSDLCEMQRVDARGLVVGGEKEFFLLGRWLALKGIPLKKGNWVGPQTGSLFAGKGSSSGPFLELSRFALLTVSNIWSKSLNWRVPKRDGFVNFKLLGKTEPAPNGNPSPRIGGLAWVQLPPIQTFKNSEGTWETRKDSKRRFSTHSGHGKRTVWNALTRSLPLAANLFVRSKCQYAYDASCLEKKGKGQVACLCV